MKIAIFGGSFDPPHIGHEEIVHKIIKQIKIDKVIVVPTYLNPFKDNFYFKPLRRFKFIRTLFKGNQKVKVSDFEIKQNRSVPTIETVNHLKIKYNTSTIYLIIGADNLEKLHLWNNFEELNSLVKFIVISRDGYEVKNDIIQFKKIDMNIDISSTSLRKNLELRYIPKKIEQKVSQLWKKESKEL